MAETKPDITSKPSPTTRVMTGGFRGTLGNRRRNIYILLAALFVVALILIIVSPLFNQAHVTKSAGLVDHAPYDTTSGAQTEAGQQYDYLVKNTDTSKMTNEEKAAFYLSLANNLTGAHRYDEAIKQFDAIKALGVPLDAQYYLGRGTVYEAKGDKATARTLYAEAKEAIATTTFSDDSAKQGITSTIDDAIARVK